MQNTLMVYKIFNTTKDDFFKKQRHSLFKIAAAAIGFQTTAD